MTIKLTKRGIDTIRPTGRALITYDTELKGFGVRIGATGTLSWFVEYRPGAGGRRVAKRRMVLGSRELTPEQARAAPKEVLAKVALGKDPAALLQREREMSTFREFAHRYLREEAAQKLKPGTVVNCDKSCSWHNVDVNLRQHLLSSRMNRRRTERVLSLIGRHRLLTSANRNGKSGVMCFRTSA